MLRVRSRSCAAAGSLGAASGWLLAMIMAAWQPAASAAVTIVIIPESERHLGQGTRSFDVNSDSLMDFGFEASGPTGLLFANVLGSNGGMLLMDHLFGNGANLDWYFDNQYFMEIGAISRTHLMVDNPFLGPGIVGFYFNPGATLAYSFQDNGTINGGNFQNTIGYLGFSYLENGLTHYGWFEVGTAGNFSMQFYRYAYETTPGQSIYLGNIPEPSRVFLLVLSVISLLCRRRRALGSG